MTLFSQNSFGRFTFHAVSAQAVRPVCPVALMTIGLARILMLKETRHVP